MIHHQRKSNRHNVIEAQMNLFEPFKVTLYSNGVYAGDMLLAVFNNYMENCQDHNQEETVL